MSLSLQMLWLLCGMGAVVFSTGAPSARRMGGVASAFAATVWLLRGGGIPDAASVAGLAAFVAGLQIYRPAWILPPVMCGGVLAGVLAALLGSQGIAGPVALIASAGLPAASMAFSARGTNFAPGTVVEEGTLLVLVLSLGTAAGPAILDGWQSAGALNAASGPANSSLPVWVLLAVSTSIVTGGLWSMWRHR